MPLHGRAMLHSITAGWPGKRRCAETHGPRRTAKGTRALPQPNPLRVLRHPSRVVPRVAMSPEYTDYTRQKNPAS